MTGSFLASGFLILANAFFVAYEFAIIAANRSDFEPDGRSSGATDQPQSRVDRAAIASFSDLSLQLAGAQLGITMASVALGYVAEPAVEHALGGILEPRVSEDVALAISIAVALSVSTFLHLVLGEMIPKNIAIATPERVVRWTVLPYRAYLMVVRPFVFLLNAVANAGCRLVGVEPRDELVSAHSAAELADIVASAAEDGSIEGESAELLHGALDFAQRPVLDVASPLDDIATIRFGATPAQAERVVRTSGQTRIPIVAPAHGQQRLVGYLHAKDLLAIDQADRFTPIPASLHRPMVLVRSDRQLIDVLRTMRRVRRQLAVVIADDGPIAVVSVEQIIRALVEAQTTADV